MRKILVVACVLLAGGVLADGNKIRVPSQAVTAAEKVAVQDKGKDTVTKLSVARATAVTSIGKESDALTKKALTDLLALIDLLTGQVSYEATNTVATSAASATSAGGSK